MFLPGHRWACPSAAGCRCRRLACTHAGGAIWQRPRWLTPTTCAALRWPCRTWRRSTATASTFGWPARDSSGPTPSAGRAGVGSSGPTSRCCSSVTRPRSKALLLGEPGIFFTTPGYDGWPLVMLRLAEVDAGRLAELVTDAWRMRAPDALAAELDEADGLPDAE